jgi:hypothetical protein
MDDMTLEQATAEMDSYSRALTAGGGHPALDKDDPFQSDAAQRVLQARRIIAAQPPPKPAEPVSPERKARRPGSTALTSGGAVDIVTRRHADQRSEDLKFALTGKAPTADAIDAKADAFIRDVMSPTSMSEEAIAFRTEGHPRQEEITQRLLSARRAKQGGRARVLAPLTPAEFEREAEDAEASAALAPKWDESIESPSASDSSTFQVLQLTPDQWTHYGQAFAGLGLEQSIFTAGITTMLSARAEHLPPATVQDLKRAWGDEFDVKAERAQSVADLWQKHARAEDREAIKQQLLTLTEPEWRTLELWGGYLDGTYTNRKIIKK